MRHRGSLRYLFRRGAHRISRGVGTPRAFLLAVLLILAQAITGPIFHYSDTWQLVINTITSLITFLMVFLIQNGQTVNTKAAHLKLDELLREHRSARTTLVNLESWSDEELEQLQKEFERLRKAAKSEVAGQGRTAPKGSGSRQQAMSPATSE